MALTTGIRIGPYEVVALLGAGGMGEVYRATDTNLKRSVAIKVMPAEVIADAERLARFEREAQVLATLNHPHIAQIYGLERASGITALVMELVDGPTLAERIGQGPLPLDEALPIARQIAEALEAAHERGIVHRDLKPANIKVRDDGAVKVLDFGLAKLNEPNVSNASTRSFSLSPTITSPALMTGVGVLLGTAAYMSPEQARGKAVDKRADIWAFGCVVYEMLTGTQPFHGSDLTETLASIVKDQPDLSKVPAPVRRLLTRCLEKDPSRRLRDLGDAWDLLEDRAQPPAVAVAPVRTRWPLALGVGVAAAAVAFGAAWTIASRPAAAPSDVQRFTVALPENAGNLHSLAISPDGRYLAIAVDVTGTRGLWLRRLDSFQAQPVPASDGAMFPFWSPDSRFVAFFANGKLKQAAVGGGPPVVICDAPDGRGGSWNRDGVIIFAPAPGLAIQQVASTGGVPVDVTKAPGTLRFPTFLPDGRHFLYLKTQAPGDQSGIRLASLDGNEDVRLLPDQSNVSFAAGRLVFVRSSTLIAQPIDPGTGHLAGDAVPIADGVPFANVTNYAPVTISASGVLVYGGPGQGSLVIAQLTWFDRQGQRLGTVGVPGRVLDPALSPNGRMVVFGRLSTSGAGLWLRALDREVEQQFATDSSVPNVEPIWSPHGDRIAFRIGFDLAEKRADGSGVAQPMVEGSQSKAPTDWSRDGQYVVFTSQDARTLLDVWFLPLNSSGRKPVPFLQSAANEHWARLSPDSRWIAYASDESGRDEVYVRPFPSGDGQWQISSAGGTEPRWRGDGKELFFIAADGSMIAATVASETTGTRLVFLPGASQPLFDTRSRPITAFSWRYDVTPDGKRFLVASPIDSSATPPLNVVVNWDAELKK